MSVEVEARVRELLDQAEGELRGPLQLSLVEEAVRLADVHQNLDLAFKARMELIEAAAFSGHPDRMLVAFAWCLAQWDRDPRRFETHSLLWRYKWILNSLIKFPQITRKQIREAFQDASRRYRARGLSLRPIYQHRYFAASCMGDRRTAAEYCRKWEAAPRDSLADCAACERNRHIDYLYDLQEDEALVLHAGPILRGRMSCAEEPHRTLARVLVPLVRLGRAEEAVAYHFKGYKLIGVNLEFIWAIGEHLLFLALTENLSRGVELLERHLRYALESPAPLSRYEFLLGMKVLLERVARNGTSTLKLRLPEGFPERREDSTYEVSSLLEWTDRFLKELADAFDARNGNRYLTRRVRALKRLHRHARPHPLGGTRKNSRLP